MVALNAAVGADKTLQAIAIAIVMALVVLAVHPFVPSIVSNGLWALALFSQIGVPIFLALRYGRRSDKML